MILIFPDGSTVFKKSANLPSSIQDTPLTQIYDGSPIRGAEPDPDAVILTAELANKIQQTAASTVSTSPNTAAPVPVPEPAASLPVSEPRSGFGLLILAGLALLATRRR